MVFQPGCCLCLRWGDDDSALVRNGDALAMFVLWEEPPLPATIVVAVIVGRGFYAAEAGGGRVIIIEVWSGNDAVAANDYCDAILF